MLPDGKNLLLAGQGDLRLERDLAMPRAQNQFPAIPAWMIVLTVSD
jgi:hypothetical protein